MTLLKLSPALPQLQDHSSKNRTRIKIANNHRLSVSFPKVNRGKDKGLGHPVNSSFHKAALLVHRMDKINNTTGPQGHRSRLDSKTDIKRGLHL